MTLAKKIKIALGIIIALTGSFIVSLTAYADGFTTWNSVNSGSTKDLNSIWGDAPGNVFAVGRSGTVLHYNGITWTPMTSGSSKDLYGIWGASGSNILAVGESGTIIHYDGSDWNSYNSGTSSDLYGVWGTGSSDVFVVGKSGTILYYNGSVWQTLNSGITNDLYGVWGTKDDNVFAVGSSGVILHYDGMAWTPLNSGITRNLYSIWGAASNDVFAVGESGVIRHFDGSAWSSYNSGTSSDLYGVWGTGSSDVFVVGKSGTIAHYDGSVFSSMNRNTLNELHTVRGFSSVDVFAAGWSGTILHYIPPVIDSISPATGDQGKAMSITITGSNLSSATEVRLGTGIAVNSFSAVGPDQLTANITIVTGAGPGPRDVSVTTPGGTFTLPGSFTIVQALPAITSVSPNSGRQGETLNITLTGTNLAGVTEMRLGPGIAVNSFSVLSANQVSASITISSGAATGARDITITTPASSFTLPGGFTVDIGMPVITSITPDSGNQESALDIIITGANFSGATEIILGAGITVNSFDVLSPNQISASISIAAGANTEARNVTVTAPGGSFTLPDSFTVKQALPVITSVSPQEGSRGAALVVTIKGKNFSGAEEVRMGPGIVVTGYNVVSAEQIEARITILSSAETGDRSVFVATPGGSFTLPDSFTIKQALPVITSVSPQEGSQGEMLTVIISGSNLDKATSVSFGAGAAVQSFNNLSPTQLRVNLQIDEDAVTGMRDVSVTTPGGRSTSANSFNIKERSTATLFVALLWVVIAVVVVLFGFLLHMIRKRKTKGI